MIIEDDRTGLSIPTIRRAMADNLFYLQGKFPGIATQNDYYMALAYTVRDRLLQRWISTVRTYLRGNVKLVCYLSAEFLLGPHLGNNLINLGIYDQVEEAVKESGLDLPTLLAQEEEPGLGNGGLGRLAACYLESLSTLEIPAVGYGIRYEFGIFDQEIKDGWQVEITDKWLQYGNPWEIARPEVTQGVKFGGRTEGYTDYMGNYRVRWIPYQTIKGVPYDTPILGYKTNTVNTLRLWKAEAPESFDFQAFNKGDYYGSVEEKVVSENITKVLYPNDEPIQGKRLRLQQQYFFVSCSLQDMIRIHLFRGDSLETFPEKFAVQLNDTHPSIGIAELMRLLVDEHRMNWNTAWSITQKTFSYTNHTLLPEALEKWSVSLFAELLPRHLEIIYEINRRFLDRVRIQYPNNNEKLAQLSLIEETGERSVRMAHLATVGSHTINGVAQLHTQLLQKQVLNNFAELFQGRNWSQKFTNVTNGVTPRRWMALCNPRLTRLISSKIGETWLTNLDELKQLEPFVDPDSLFDVQCKRLHEYKRQHLNVLHIIALYQRLKDNPNLDLVPRTFIFAAKAAPGYFLAKLIIKLINSVGDVLNNDPMVRDRLKVVFIPDYNVTNSQYIYPAADLSEQISTAGKEASGTGNMKFALNGALTIGTLDGANVEMREEVGTENFFLFGLQADEVADLKAQGYIPRNYYQRNPQLKQVIDLISSGFFSGGDRELFAPLVNSLMNDDPYLLFADFNSYLECQSQVSAAYRDQERWTRMSTLNVARMGKFSSDRSIKEYCDRIWHTQPVKVELEEYVQANAGLSV